MSNVIIDRQKIDILANAISDKSGVPVTMTLDEMVDAVDGIQTGGGGITPTGNIDISSAGVTDVTNYATATVPTAGQFAGTDYQYVTIDNARKWRLTASTIVDPEEGCHAGWLDEGVYAGVVNTFDAIPANTIVTPTESAQTIGGADYMMEGVVTVNAIPSTYIGSGITQRSSSDLTISGATITVPSGYYSATASKSLDNAVFETLNIAQGFVTESGTRKWLVQPHLGVESEGYIGDGDIYGDDIYYNAISANTVITPTESSQTIGGAYYMMEGAVTVDAISSTYVGSGITQRSSTDLTASGATVTAPAGYYAEAASKSVSSMTLPTSATSSATSGYTSKATIGRSTAAQYINIPPGYNSTGAYYVISAVANGSATAPSTISGTSATVSTGTNTLTLTKTVSVTPTVSAGYISSGTARNSSVSLTASVTTKAATTYNTSTSNQTIAAGTYLTGAQTIRAVTTSNLSAANVKSGVVVTVGDSADAGRIASITGTFTSDATATAADIIGGATAYINGSKVSGTMVVQKYYTGSSAPSSSLGNNGDIYIQV